MRCGLLLCSALFSAVISDAIVMRGNVGVQSQCQLRGRLVVACFETTLLLKQFSLTTTSVTAICFEKGFLIKQLCFAPKEDRKISSKKFFHWRKLIFGIQNNTKFL